VDKREPEIEKLLNAARDAAVASFQGRRADKALLNEMASFCRDYVLRQADLGMWGKWTIADGRDLANLGCVVEIRPTLSLAPPVRIVWNFARTPLWFLETH